MRITGLNSTRPAAPKKRTGSTSEAGAFSGILSSAEADMSSPASAAGETAAPLAAGFLALQEIPADEARNRQQIARGKTTLDKLEQLRHALLAGMIPTHLLGEISRLVASERERSGDPALLAILDDIDLRAAVELAKLEVAVEQKNASTPEIP